MRKNSFLFLSSAFFLWGCSKSSSRFSNVEWNGSGATPKVDIAIDPSAKTVSDGDQRILLASQVIDGAPIEKSYFKKITSSDGTPTFLSASYLDKEEVEVLQIDIAKLKPQLKSFSKILRSTMPTVKNSRWVSEPQIVVADTVFGPKAVVKIDYEADDGYIYEVQMSPNQNIIQKKRMGSLYESAHALVFPEGPDRSSLMDVLLSNLLGNGSLLQNSVLRISSETPDTAVGTDNSFKFNPPDHRFDQVQVYYFIDRYLNWFREKTGVTLPFQVNVVTHVGFPNKRAVAYYYHGEVRLGEGDDVVFARMLYDPSIVTHEFGHAIIDSLAGLPFEGQGGSINEGFADFFACSHLETPYLGEVAYKKAAYNRTVANTITLSEANGGLYHDSGIVSGTLWEIRTVLGNDEALKFALNVLVKLTPSSNLKELGEKLNEVSSATLKGDLLAKVNAILQQRGWVAR